MYNDLKQERIIVDIKSYSEVDDLQNENRDDVDLYCDFMKERFMMLSGLN